MIRIWALVSIDRNNLQTSEQEVEPQAATMGGSSTQECLQHLPMDLLRRLDIDDLL